jgi:isoquinoline 1-oxidoreductase subunit beta
LMKPTETSRRDFLKLISTTGAGLAIGVFTWDQHALASDSEQELAPNAWLAIDSAGIVTVWVGRAEMGQGVRTSMPMLVAEELEADWSRIRVEQALADPKYGNMVTGGSQSVRGSWKPLREAGAAAREMLISAAALEWGVDRSTCFASNGEIIHKPTGRKLGYGKLAGKAARLPIPEHPPLKEPRDFRFIGKRMPRLDTAGKISGTAHFGIDTTVPGMLTATIERSPVIGGSVKKYDATKALSVPGVRKVVEVPSGIAVLADTTWAALQGREKLQVEWNEGPNADLSTESIHAMFVEKSATQGSVMRTEGDVAKALAAAARRLDATYELPFLAHATLEPMNCIAHVRADAIEIWAPSQSPLVARGAVAEAMKVPFERVTLHPTLVGGGFGRRLWPDWVVEATMVSKAAGAPVKVVWTREDDMKNDFYRPASYHRLSAGIDAQGTLSAWQHRVVAPSITAQLMPQESREEQERDAVDGAVGLPYATPNLLVDYVMANSAVPILWWRSVYNSQHAFVNESFLDEIAALAGKDPFEYRRSLLPKDSRLRGVLELAAERAGWGKPLPPGMGRGIACHFCFSSYVAHVAEVSVSKEGKVRVHRVVSAVDCGRVVNPDGVVSQIEGGVLFGLTAASYGEITIAKGRIQQSSYDTYKLMQYDEIPEIEVHIQASDADPSGVGEPGVPPIAPAVCNAIFAATGKRVRKLPIRLS